ncbi:uncharacterized protein LOC116804362 [Drosophila mojavensis]|uniref:uncharacterized protein LOC116804362 n=1 Tax=Drosophila mojavensis TaxID=7230 RepID=UPI0013EE5DC5|nr:uncharacterized protein LOC116804362 [Drosophila mojavensis]
MFLFHYGRDASSRVDYASTHQHPIIFPLTEPCYTPQKLIQFVEFYDVETVENPQLVIICLLSKPFEKGSQSGIEVKYGRAALKLELCGNLHAVDITQPTPTPAPTPSRTRTDFNA